MENKKDKSCSICGKKISGFGNNAKPVNSGLCCDDCNDSIVIPARVEAQKTENQK